MKWSVIIHHHMFNNNSSSVTTTTTARTVLPLSHSTCVIFRYSACEFSLRQVSSNSAMFPYIFAYSATRQGVWGCHTPQAQFLSAQDQVLHFCRQISKIVIYIGKMQKFSCLSAKRYAPVQFVCKLKTYRQNSFVMLWSNVSACKRFV